MTYSAIGAIGARKNGRHLGVALLVIATAQLMVVLDATVVDVALPRIQAALGFSGSGLEWVVNAYALAFGGLLLLGGRVGDLLGRRRMFVAGAAAGLIAGGLLVTYASWRWVLFVNVPIGIAAALAAPAVLPAPRPPRRRTGTPWRPASTGPSWSPPRSPYSPSWSRSPRSGSAAPTWPATSTADAGCLLTGAGTRRSRRTGRLWRQGMGHRGIASRTP